MAIAGSNAEDGKADFRLINQCLCHVILHYRVCTIGLINSFMQKIAKFKTAHFI